MAPSSELMAPPTTRPTTPPGGRVRDDTPLSWHSANTAQQGIHGCSVRVFTLARSKNTMATISFRHLGDLCLGFRTGGLLAGLRVALALGMLVGSARSLGNAPLAAAAAPIACTTTPSRIIYGDDSRFQFGDLRVPSGPGPHPVAVIIHGGCWLNLFGLDLMDGTSEALTAAGLATWNIEYRRLGDPGGGYPNTFTDVGLAIDTVRDLAPRCNLDLGNVMTVGHSA